MRPQGWYIWEKVGREWSTFGPFTLRSGLAEMRGLREEDRKRRNVRELHFGAGAPEGYKETPDA